MEIAAENRIAPTASCRPTLENVFIGVSIGTIVTVATAIVLGVTLGGFQASRLTPYIVVGAIGLSTFIISTIFLKVIKNFPMQDDSKISLKGIHDNLEAPQKIPEAESLIYPLPSEITNQIFEYLSPEDLVQVGAACKPFYKIAQNKDLPAWILIPKLSSIIIQENALTLWNSTEKNFIVDSESRLTYAAFYHDIARFFLCEDEDEDIMKNKVNKAIEVTLLEIYRLNEQGCTEPEYKKNQQGCIERVQPSEHRHLYVYDPYRFRSFYHPADYLADKILGSEQFSDPGVRKAAQLVKDQAGMYDDIREKYGIYDNAPDKRVGWGPLGIDKEAFFSQGFYEVS